MIAGLDKGYKGLRVNVQRFPGTGEIIRQLITAIAPRRQRPRLAGEVSSRVQPWLIVRSVIDHIEREAVAKVFGSQRVFAAGQRNQSPVLSVKVCRRRHLQAPAAVSNYIQRLTGPLEFIGQTIVKRRVEAHK